MVIKAQYDSDNLAPVIKLLLNADITTVQLRFDNEFTPEILGNNRSTVAGVVT